MKENKLVTTIYTGDKLQNQFTAYIERALRNNRVSYYRKNKTRQNTEIPVGTEDKLNLHMDIYNDTTNVYSKANLLHPDTLHHEGLSQELRNISEKSFTIICLRIIYGYSYKKIGTLIGMKEEAVRVRYFRAIQKIRDNLKGEQK